MSIQNLILNGITHDFESGFPNDAKQALLACFQQVAWVGDDGQDYYNALEEALYPPENLLGLSCSYTQSGTVYDTDSLASLRRDLVVMALWEDSTTSNITNYVLSGTLSAGTSTITVHYGGKSTTFTVTVTERLSSISVSYTQSGTVYENTPLADLANDLTVTATYTDATTEVISYPNYSLSGTLQVGTSSITVTYGSKIGTFTVNVSDNALYRWNFKNSIVDTAQGASAVLSEGVTQNGSGLTFSATTDYVYLADMNAYSTGQFTVEIDIANLVATGGTSPFALSARTAINDVNGLVFHASAGYWMFVMTDSSRKPLVITSASALNGKTVKIVYDVALTQTWSLYIDGQLVDSKECYINIGNKRYLGIYGLPTGSIITGVRVYEGVV